MPELMMVEVDFLKETIKANTVLLKQCMSDNAIVRNLLAEAAKATAEAAKVTAECGRKESQIKKNIEDRSAAIRYSLRITDNLRDALK